MRVKSQAPILDAKERQISPGALPGETAFEIGILEIARTSSDSLKGVPGITSGCMSGMGEPVHVSWTKLHRMACSSMLLAKQPLIVRSVMRRLGCFGQTPLIS